MNSWIPVIAIAGILLGAAAILAAGDWITDPGQPIQVSVTLPTISPTHTPQPTPTPRHYIPGPDEAVGRLVQQHDDCPRANALFQRGRCAFTLAQFQGHDAVGQEGNTFRIPPCIPGGSYPWTRYGMALPATRGTGSLPSAIVLDSLAPWTNEFQVQSGVPLSIGDTFYVVLITKGRHDCRVLEGHTWTLHNN